MKNFLVTGSGGFIGKRLVNAIDGKVKVVSRERRSDYETVVCDLEKDPIPKDLFKCIDVVFHLAGIAHDTKNLKSFGGSYYAVNVDATYRLAKLASNSRVKKFVFISSVKAGGAVIPGKCMNESDQRIPEGLYAESKREAELQLLKIGKESGMHVSIIRPSLVYGPKVKGNLRSMLIGITKGWFPPLPEINNRRSMIHVDDLVEAILLVAEDERANGEIFIATDGTPYSSREIYNVLCSLSGRSISKWSTPKILFDIASLVSPGIKYKLNKLLGDECYSSDKLETLGFEAKKSLKDMNETDF